MKTSSWIQCWVVAAFFCSPGAARAGLFEDSRLSNLPASVRQTVTSVLGSGRLTDLVLTNDNGAAVYEVEMRLRGVERSFTVAADGSLVARQILLDELPPAVLKTVQRETAAGQVQELYWLNHDGDPAYYIERLQGRQPSWLIAAPDGWVTSRRVELTETPAPVQTAVREKLQGRIPAEVARAMDGDEVTFEVTDLVLGRERVWILNPDGSVAAEPLLMSAVPGPARTTLTRQSGGARIRHLFKIPNGDSFLYEAWFVRQEARHVCTVDAEGRIASEELPLIALPETLQKSIKAKAEGRFIVRIEKSPREKGATYEVILRRQGKTEALIFSADGTVIPSKSPGP